MRFLVLFSGLAISAAVAGAFEARAAEPLRVLNKIVWVRGADLAEISDTLQQNRDQVRKDFMRELVGALKPFIYSGSDMVELAKVMGGFLKEFDGIHAQHKNDALRGLGISLDSLLKSQIDELYRENRISREERKLHWVNDSKPEAVDAVFYGSYSLARGALVLTLTLRELFTGKETNFVVSGSVGSVTALLANEVFRFFQSAEYPAWINPQPHLTWIAFPNSKPVSSFADARRYCEGQNARLPFAQELVQASQGDGVHPGSIPALLTHLPAEVRRTDSRVGYAVADQQRVSGPTTYFPQLDLASSPVQSTRLFPTNAVLVWCVRGAPSDSVRFTDELYRVLRSERKKQKSGEAPSRAQMALEYLLADQGAYGSASEVLSEFDSPEDAVLELKRAGYSIAQPIHE